MERILDMVEDYIIILDKCLNIQFCNKKLLAKLEYNMGELNNISIEKLLKTKNENLNIDIKKNNRQDKLKINLDLYSNSGEMVSVYSDIIVDNFKEKESIFIVSRDICEKSYKREDLEKILDTIPFNCWLKNMNGEYVYLNESYAKELKDNRLNILGKKTKDYWGTERGSLFDDMDKEVIESRKYQITESQYKEGNLDLWVETYKGPIINKNNELEYIIGFTKDITLRKKLENEMYINDKEINSLNNILVNTNSKNSIYDLLNNIGENMLNYIECDGISILSINKNELCLDIDMNCGLEHKYKANNEMLKFNLNKLNELDNSKLLNKINNIKDIEDKMLKDYMRKNKIDNIGIYNIAFNDEIIGFLVLKFLVSNTPRFNKLDYLNTICGNIATMIKSHTLSKEVKEEFKNRIEIEHELELFLDISVDLIARGNINGEIKYVNNNWSKTLGWREDELLSMNILDIIHKEFKTECISIKNGLKNDTGSVVSKLICKDGSYKWVECNYKILRNDDKFIITAKDISEAKRQEDERKNLKEAIQMESLKNEFFANISHEFRTPINIILGTMQLMKRNVDENKISWDSSLNLESHINYIKQNSYRLLKLVNNLIDITCIDSGYLQLQLGNYNIVEIVENITLSVAQHIKNQGKSLIFDTNIEEKIIACDPDKIERIMLNLLSNAIKYIDENGYIHVYLEADDEKIKISIKDNGVGISKDKLGIVFDRFKKIDNNLNRKCEGSGIGLSLVKSLVELQDGNIYANSELGVGSEFIFELPVRVIEDSDEIILNREILKSTQIEKCNIEFSDIYS